MGPGHRPEQLRNGVEASVGPLQRVALLDERRHIRERAHAQLATDLLRALGARIVEADETRPLQVLQDSYVMVAECARTNDANLRWSRAQMMTPRSLPSRKRRKCSTSGDRGSSNAARSMACETFSSDRKNSR